MQGVEDFLKIAASLFSLIAGLVTALWVYTKYVLERGFLPPVRFSVVANKLGMAGNENILDIKIHLDNIGSTTLIARNIRLDLFYITADDPVKKPLALFTDIKAGRLEFPNQLTRIKGIEPSALIPEKIRNDVEKMDRWRQQKVRGFLVSERDTFVQAGVDQVYTFVTKVPGNALCVLTWCSFHYAQRPSRWQSKVSQVSRWLGLIQYTLEHVREPHTVEDVFWIEDKAQPTVTPDRQERVPVPR